MKKLLLTLLVLIYPSTIMSIESLMDAKLIDLTHSFGENTIYWPTEAGFQLEKEHFGMTDRGYFYSSNKLSTPEHGGTHLDAPIHFAEKGITVERIPLQQLMGVAIVVDIVSQCAKNRDYLINTADFLAWEKQHGKIPKDAIILLQTGFSKYWPDRLKYLGTVERGKSGVEKLRFPGLEPQAAQWLITHRHIKAVGINTASIDHGPSKLFETHRILADQNIPIFENIAALEKLPPKDFSVIALPMKISQASGAPLRIVAILK